MNGAPLALALLAAPLAWISLMILEKILPTGLLAAQMREQPPGTMPIRQLGGLGVVPFYLVALALLAGRFPDARPMLGGLGAAIALLWFVGMADDHRHRPAGLRLAAHAIAAAAVAFTLPSSWTILGDMLPAWLERGLIAFALICAINVTNFMDGMDLMSVAGCGIPISACALLLSDSSEFVPIATASLAIAAALAGFAIFNRPPARLYLGDNGALPLGLACGTACIALAVETNVAAATLPFFYYLADSGSTLLRRLTRGENPFQSHSAHAYQAARRAGKPVRWVLARVIAVNLVLAALAWFASVKTDAGALWLTAICGAVVAAGLVVHFRRQAGNA